MANEQKSRHYVLVHGACLGAWCWYKLKPLLESAGNHVTAVDLAASGINLEDPSAINTLDDLAKPFMKLVASIPADEKVILVGHSYGGFSIGLAMENYPEKISVAVFLSAFMPDVTHTLDYIRDARKSEYFCMSYSLLELAKLLKRPTPELQQDFSTRKFSGEGYGSVKRVYMMASMDTYPTSFVEWQIRNFPPEEEQVRLIEGADHMSMHDFTAS